MIRSFHLGNEGEDAAQHLLDVYDLSTNFEPCLAISPHPRALDELRRRLAEKAGRLERWEPDDELGSRARSLIEEAAGSRPVIWLQQERFDPEGWKGPLIHLQRQRELYRAEAPWLWVLAGPPELVRLMHEYAMHILTGVTVHVTLEEAPRRLATAQGPIRWLHLSDFHFQALQRWERRQTLQALLRHVEKLRDEGLRPDFVFVTGDVAFSGQLKEYDQAVLFFTKLAETLEIEPRERFFFVPGNHDVDRGAIGAGDRRILKGVDSQDDVEDLFGDPQAMALLGRRLEGFYAFTERFLGTARGWRSECPWRVDVRQAGGVDIGILQLNSAWTSSLDDSAGLVVGEVQLQQALEECADAFLRIALVHHPLADLKDFDRERLETLYAAEDVHFLLRGHLHRNRTQSVATPDGLVVELAAGAVYPGGEYDKTYLAAEADLGAGQATVRFYRYGATGRGFWAPDNQAYERAENGIWTFELPAGLRLDSESPASAERELTPSRRATLAARYRDAAAAVHGTVRFVGFADHRPRPNVQVPELFVPLRLGTRDKENASWTTKELIGRLLHKPAEGEGAARISVLGDPGSGKTTLCRFAAVVIAGESDCEGLRATDDVLPLFLPFRDYVRVCRETGERGLVDYLTDQARAQLQVALPEGFLEAALNDGRAVLLLDGLDEVGAAEDREAMRERVQAFCRLYPRTPVLVTSRVAGYEEAPLPRQGPDGFVHLKLAPFDDDDLQRFVSSWYAVQEATDPVARSRGTADLTAALDADERVRELARNPMLATLIALVHRYEAHLPGERAALYDLCVKTLIETWPAAKKRTFREIDERLQRAYLEELALHMQRQRSEGDKEVVIERGALVDALVEILRQRGGTLGSEETRGLVERWVRFLEEGTGIVVEQRPGVFAFLHLSLMEYLAARGLDAEGNLVDALAELLGQTSWSEVCLLAVGNRATDKAFLDRLYEALCEQPLGWWFLFYSLREEAAFDDRQRQAIVRCIGKLLLDMMPWDWIDCQRVLDELMRFSLRHQEWAREWVANEIATSDGEALQAIVALRSQGEAEVLADLGKRPDAKNVAPDLLDFLPLPHIGRWAAAVAEARESFLWARRSPGEVLILRSVAAIQEVERLAPGYVAGLLRWVYTMEVLARRNADLVVNDERPGGQGLPAVVFAKTGSIVVQVAPVGQLPLAQQETADISQYFTHAFARTWPLYIPYEVSITDFALGIAPSFPPSFDGFFAPDLISNFYHQLAEHCVLFFPGHEGDVLFFPRPNWDFTGYALDFLEVVPKPQLSDPRQDQVPPDALTLRDLIKGHRERETNRVAATGPARLATEAWIAAATTAKASHEEQAVYIHRRVQNAWLLQVWPAVDGHLSDVPDPAQMALYLALGFSQATTTWQWPATERWIALLSKEPMHWLPRSQWHLCYLLHDPKNAAHRRALDEALDEGLKDAESPWVAEELRKLIVPAA